MSNEPNTAKDHFHQMMAALSPPTHDTWRLGEENQVVAIRGELKQEIRLSKSGEFFPAGAQVEVVFDAHNFRLAWMRVQARQEPIKISVTKLSQYVTGFLPPPSLDVIKAQAEKGVGTTPTGKDVESDGIADDGSPSWALALRIKQVA